MMLYVKEKLRYGIFQSQSYGAQSCTASLRDAQSCHQGAWESQPWLAGFHTAFPMWMSHHTDEQPPVSLQVPVLPISVPTVPLLPFLPLTMNALPSTERHPSSRRPSLPLCFQPMRDSPLWQLRSHLLLPAMVLPCASFRQLAWNGRHYLCLTSPIDPLFLGGMMMSHPQLL